MRRYWKLVIGSMICVAGIIGMSGCLKVGSSVGSNAVLLNASVLKGQMGYGTVTVFDPSGEEMWAGEADESGLISIDLRDSVTGILRVSVAPNERSFMICDALECAGPDSDESMPFGEPVSLASQTDFELSTRIYVAATSSFQTSLQINGLTELTSQFITFTATDDLIDSAEAFEAQARLASQLIMASLGVNITDEINLLDFELLNVNENLELGDEAENDSLLSLLNASFASDLTTIRLYSNALHALILDLENVGLQAEFEQIQKRVLRHALNLSDSGQLGGILPEVQQQIANAATTPLRFERFTAILATILNDNGTFSLDLIQPFWAYRFCSERYVASCAGNLSDSFAGIHSQSEASAVFTLHAFSADWR